MISTYKLFKIGARLAPLIPFRLAKFLYIVVGNLVYFLVPKTRRAVLSNLSRVIPEKSEKERRRTARQVLVHVMRNYYDLFRIHKLSPEQIKAQINLVDFDLVYEGLARGKGVMAVCAHQGSFSFISQIASAANLDFYLTVEPIKPPELFELVRELREVDSRTHTIAVGGSEVRNIFRALKENHMVCLAIDRDVSGNGKMLPFFGKPAMLPTGAAEIALRTGTTVLTAHLYENAEGKHELKFYPGLVAESTGDKEADIKRITSWMFKEVENRIREHPDEWVVLQPLWPES